MTAIIPSAGGLIRLIMTRWRRRCIRRWRARLMATKPDWLKGTSNLEYSYNVIAYWLSNGSMASVAHPNHDALAELQKAIMTALDVARRDALEEAAQIADKVMMNAAQAQR